MLEVIGDLIPLALGVALSPFPIIAVVLLLLSPGGKGSSIAFAVGRVVGVAAIVALCGVLISETDDSSQTSLLLSLARIAIGAGLLVLAVRKWRGRPRGDDPGKLPGWMSRVEQMGPVRALGLALAMSMANPKELVFSIAAGITLGAGHLALAPTLGAAAVYTAIASVSVVVPVLAAAVAGPRAQAPLESMRVWLLRNNATVLAVVLLLLGGMLIGGGIGGL